MTTKILNMFYTLYIYLSKKAQIYLEYKKIKKEKKWEIM